MAKQLFSIEKVAERTTSAISVKRRMFNIEVSDILFKKKLKRDTELLALADEPKGEGKTDLALRRKNIFMGAHASKTEGKLFPILIA